MEKCAECGFNNEKNAKFCFNCGKIIKTNDTQGLNIGTNSAVSAHDIVGGNKEIISGNKEIVNGNKEEIHAQNYTLNQTVIHQSATTNNHVDAEMMEIAKKKQMLEVEKLEAEIAKLRNEPNGADSNIQQQKVDAEKIAKLKNSLEESISALHETQSQIKQAHEQALKSAKEVQGSKAYAPLYAPTPKKNNTNLLWIIGGVVVAVMLFFVFKGKNDTIEKPLQEHNLTEAQVEEKQDDATTTAKSVTPTTTTTKSATPTTTKSKALAVTTTEKNTEQPKQEQPKPQQEVDKTPVKADVAPSEMTPDEAYQTAKLAVKQGGYAKAAKYYQSAADRGIAVAAYELSLLYQHGSGVSRDAKSAFVYMKAAAEAGCKGAFRPLGEMYHGGRGVAKDRSLAEKWYKKAVDSGDEKAKKILYNM